jgi:oxygen-independent coproporphyrinogen-3 oxidase
LNRQDWGLYVHIPFCRHKCFYCDFASYAGREGSMARYTDALKAELERRAVPLAGRYGPPRTVYLGGGTPTALPETLMARLLAAIRRSLFPSGGAGPLEFTVEANPGTVDASYLSMLRQSGVSRISFGVQSFDDSLLRRIGRIHTAVQAEEAFRAARQAGFANISLDLMYGLPGQTLDDLRDSVEKAVALGPDHISIYGLQVEEGTVFFRERESGRLTLPTEQEAEEMYDFMTRRLPEAGYARYEISNFARPGFESRHNLSYWQDVPYLGIGAAAHSYLAGVRYENERELSAYLEPCRGGEEPRAAGGTSHAADRDGGVLLPRAAHGARHRQAALPGAVRRDAFLGLCGGDPAHEGEGAAGGGCGGGPPHGAGHEIRELGIRGVPALNEKSFVPFSCVCVIMKET